MSAYHFNGQTYGTEFDLLKAVMESIGIDIAFKWAGTIHRAANINLYHGTPARTEKFKEGKIG